MSAIRHGDEGFNAYIYFDTNKRLSISTPSVTMTTSDMSTAKAVFEVLVVKKEVPENIWERVMQECWDLATFKHEVRDVRDIDYLAIMAVGGNNTIGSGFLTDPTLKAVKKGMKAAAKKAVVKK